MRYSPSVVERGQTVTTKEVSASSVEFVSDTGPAILPKNTVLRFEHTVYYWQGRRLHALRMQRVARIGHGESPSDYVVEFAGGEIIPVRKLNKSQEAVVEYVPKSLKARSSAIIAQMERHEIVEI